MQTHETGEIQSLVRGIAAADERACEELYLQVRACAMPALLRRVRDREVAEDLCHDIFLHALQMIQRGALQHPQAIWSIIKLQVRWRLINRFREERPDLIQKAPDPYKIGLRSRDSVFGLDGKLDPRSAAQDPEMAFGEAEERTILFAAIAKLRPREREILRRNVVDGESMQSVAVGMGLSFNIARGVRNRAKAEVIRRTREKVRADAPKSASLLNRKRVIA